MAERRAFLCAANRFGASTYTIRGEFAGNLQTVTITVSTDSDWFVQYTGVPGDADDLLEALRDALNTNSWGLTFTPSMGEDGLITLDAHDGDFRILWNDAATTFDKTLFGFTGTTPAIADDTVTGTAIPKSIWVPDQPLSETNYGDPEIVSAIERTLSGKTLTAKLNNDVDEHRLRWMLIDQARVKDYFGTSAPYNVMEWFFKNYLTLGREFRCVYDIGDPDSEYVRLRLKDHRIPWTLEKFRMLTSYAVEIFAREVAE